jgi:hypothetical protein
MRELAKFAVYSPISYTAKTVHFEIFEFSRGLKASEPRLRACQCCLKRDQITCDIMSLRVCSTAFIVSFSNESGAFFARFVPFVSFLSRVKMTEASASTSVRKKIKFNGNLYDGWSAVRDAYTSVCTKSRAKGVWGVVRLDSETPGDSTGPFVLPCKGCSKTCQLANPSKWFGEHKCKGPKGAAGKVSKALSDGPAIRIDEESARTVQGTVFLSHGYKLHTLQIC